MRLCVIAQWERCAHVGMQRYLRLCSCKCVREAGVRRAWMTYSVSITVWQISFEFQIGKNLIIF